MSDELQPIRDALRDGDKQRAQQLLRPLLEHPTAEIWYLAANASTSREKAIANLKRALALDPWHTQADRMLLKLDKVQKAQNQQASETPHRNPSRQPRPTSSISRSQSPFVDDGSLAELDLIAPSVDTLVGDSKAIDKAVLPTLKKAKSTRKRSVWGRIGCIAGIVLSLSSSLLVMNLLGLAIGLTGGVKVALGGATPISEVNGVPIDQVVNPALVVEPEKTESIAFGESLVDSLNDGYAHEYEFNVRTGQEVVVFVQFLSPMASRVNENVAVLDASGRDAESRCTRDAIVGGNTGVTFTCRINSTGQWSVKIFGRDGQSIGVYFVSVNQLGT